MRYGGFLHVTTFWHNFVVPDISRNFSGFAGDSQKGWHNIEKKLCHPFLACSRGSNLIGTTTQLFLTLTYARKNKYIAFHVHIGHINKT